MTGKKNSKSTWSGRGAHHHSYSLRSVETSFSPRSNVSNWTRHGTLTPTVAALPPAPITPRDQAREGGLLSPQKSSVKKSNPQESPSALNATTVAEPSPPSHLHRTV